MKKTTKVSILKLVTAAILSAIAAVLQFIEISIPIIPSFVKLDFSDLPALLGAFSLGPAYGVAIQLVKNILHLPFGSSAGVGEICNFLLGAVFVFTAGMIYKYKKTRTGAVIAAVSGAVAMALVSLPVNYFFVYPAYVKIYNMPLDVILSMYNDILPGTNSLIKALCIFNVPFTFFKGIACAVFSFLIYKPLSSFLKGTINKM